MLDLGAVPWWCTWVLGILGLGAMWLSGSRPTVGWAATIAAQLLWVAYVVVTGQWGLVASGIALLVVFVRNYFFSKRTVVSEDCDG